MSRHRALVRHDCFRVGLYWQGITHDLSKYSPDELIPSIRFFSQGTRSPLSAERKYQGYSTAWMHHKGHNKHHYEYWTDYPADGKSVLECKEMPVRYVVEMCIDRVCASKVYNGSSYCPEMPLLYLQEGREATYMCSETYHLLEQLLTCLANEGEASWYQHMRQLLYGHIE